MPVKVCQSVKRTLLLSGPHLFTPVVRYSMSFLLIVMVQKTALNFRFLWLKNKVEINLFENLHSFKVAEASV